MIDTVEVTRENLKRIPGLYRRWELPEILEPNRKYHIEQAGEHTDGTPLLAIYASAVEHRAETVTAPTD